MGRGLWRAFDTTSLRLQHSSLSYGFLPIRLSLTLISQIRYSRSSSPVMLKFLTPTAYASHHVTPATRFRSTPVKNLLFKQLTLLTGWNRSSYELGRRSFSSDLDSDTKSSTTTVSAKPHLDDCLTVCSNFFKITLFFFPTMGNFMIMGNVRFPETIELGWCTSYALIFHRT